MKKKWPCGVRRVDGYTCHHGNLCTKCGELEVLTRRHGPVRDALNKKDVIIKRLRKEARQ